jgi:hypothetical protein
MHRLTAVLTRTPIVRVRRGIGRDRGARRVADCGSTYACKSSRLAPSAFRRPGSVGSIQKIRHPFRPVWAWLVLGVALAAKFIVDNGVRVYRMNACCSAALTHTEEYHEHEF